MPLPDLGNRGGKLCCRLRHPRRFAAVAIASAMVASGRISLKRIVEQGERAEPLVPFCRLLVLGIDGAFGPASAIPRYRDPWASQRVSAPRRGLLVASTASRAIYRCSRRSIARSWP